MPSAGTISAVWPITDTLALLTVATNSSMLRFTWKPGKDSSLSRVPPVWPRPRPDILATGTPAAATRGASTMVVVSPTPPVLCLSTLMPSIPDRSTRVPLLTMASVSQAISRVFIPRKYTAIAQAAI